MGLNLDTQMDQIMQYCTITIIASVEPDQPMSKSMLDALEAELQDIMDRREERRTLDHKLGRVSIIVFSNLM